MIKRILVIIGLCFFPTFIFSQTRPSYLDLKDPPLVDPRFYGFSELAAPSVNKAALTMALNNGSLFIPEGSYIVDNTTPITIGSASAEILSFGKTVLHPTNQTQPIFLVSANDVKITGLTFSGLDIYKGQEYRYVGDRPALIKASGVDNLSITNCRFINPSVHSILFYGVTRSTISTCYFSSDSDYLVVDDPLPGNYLGYVTHIGLYGAAGCSVVNNRFAGNICGIQGNGNASVLTDLGDGMGALKYTRKNIISDNYISSKKSNCIYFSSDNKDNVISKNVLIAEAEEPLHSVGDGAIITNNKMVCGANGPTIRGSSGVTFDGNDIQCSSAAAVGLYVYTKTSYDSPLHRISITNNTFTHLASGTNGGAAIGLFSFKEKNGPARFEDIVITGNNLVGWGGANPSGGAYEGIIDLEQRYDETAGEAVPIGLVISKNRIKGVYNSGFGVSGIRVRGGFLNVNISDNVIDGIGGGAPGNYYGMFLQAVGSAVVANNQITMMPVAGNTAHGIYEVGLTVFGAGTIGSIVATSTNNVYVGNNIIGRSGVYISIADSSSRVELPPPLKITEIVDSYTLPSFLHPKQLLLYTASSPAAIATITPSVTSSTWASNHIMEVFNRSSSTTMMFGGQAILPLGSALFQQVATGTAANTWEKLR